MILNNILFYYDSLYNLTLTGNIEGFRSSSDVSDDEEDKVPNISAAVLRSSRRVVTYVPAEKCLGEHFMMFKFMFRIKES